MPFKIEFDTSILSLRALGVAVVALAGLLGLIGVFEHMFLAPAAILALVGLAFYGRKHEFIARREKEAVAEKIAKTLELMNWKHEQENDTINVPAANTRVLLRALGMATLVQFRFIGKVGKEQDFLVRAIVKFLRHSK